MKQFFLLKLIAPRLTFPQDMTEAERRLMGEHLAYWNGLTERGTAVLFGPVSEPSGTWGLAVVEVEDEAAARAAAAADPVSKAGAGFRWDVFPMRVGMLRAAQRA